MSISSCMAGKNKVGPKSNELLLMSVDCLLYTVSRINYLYVPEE